MPNRAAGSIDPLPLHHLRQLADTVPLAVFRIGLDRRLRFANRRFEELFGLSVGDEIPSLLDDGQEDAIRAELLAQNEVLQWAGGHGSQGQADLAGHVEPVEFDLVVPGTSRVVRIQMVASPSPTGDPEAIGYCSDITEQRSRSADLIAEARTDPLSGLANRKALTEFIELHDDQGIAVILCDLDGFKQVNDTHGHAAGDVVITTFAERLQNAMRPTDLVARIGGDEFVIIAPGVTKMRDAQGIADRCHPLFRIPVDFEGTTIELSATIGVALGRRADENFGDLLRLADHALYEAKHSGRDRVQVYDGDGDDEALTPLVLRRELRRALEAEELHLELQPVFQLDDSPRLVAAEALLRWNHPRFGRISPGHIIPVAEQTGMVRPLGRWVAEMAARTVADLERESGEEVRIGVNLSAAQIADPEFVPSLGASFDRHGLAPSAIQIELTESHRVHEVNGAVEAIHALSAMGCQITMDDFGAGVSTYQYLLTLPIDIVKADRAFVSHVTTPRGFTMLQSFARACTDLGIQVVAEGIETPGQLLAVVEAGVHVGQGYLLSRPVPASDLLDARRQGFELIDAREATRRRAA